MTGSYSFAQAFPGPLRGPLAQPFAGPLRGPLGRPLLDHPHQPLAQMLRPLHESRVLGPLLELFEGLVVTAVSGAAARRFVLVFVGWLVSGMTAAFSGK